MADQVYTREQRVAAMKAAGWPTDIIPVGVAVSLAESWSGVGINNNPPVEYSVGPWQINLLAHKNITEAQALDLNYSTAYALQLWQSQGFNPWGAFTNGSYLRFFDGSATADAGPVASKNPGIGLGQSSQTPSSKPTLPASNIVGTQILGFQFPTLAIGPWNVDSSPLFKVAMTIGALFLLFYGITAIASPSITVKG